MSFKTLDILAYLAVESDETVVAAEGSRLSPGDVKHRFTSNCEL